MFNKNVRISVITSMCNGDDLKVRRLTDIYRDPKSVTKVEVISDNKVIIKFTTLESFTKQFRHDLCILKLMGIKAEIAA